MAADAIPSCFPNHDSVGRDGTVSYQQAGAGRPITWGVRANEEILNTNGHWVIDLYADGTRRDHKDQMYMPHGTLPAQYVVAGKILQIKGEVTLPGENVRGNIDGRCRMT